MPIRTTLVTCARHRVARAVLGGRAGQSPSRSRAIMIWPTISPAVRLRTSFCVPVWQKRAGERAADLARDAERAAVLLGDDRRSRSRLAVGARRSSHLRVPSTGDLLGDDLRPREGEARRKLRTEILGDVGHGEEVGHAPHIEPAPKLACAHARLPLANAQLRHPRGKLGAAEPDQGGVRLRRAGAGRRDFAGRRRHGHDARASPARSGTW